jgi:hypothetical protein
MPKACLFSFYRWCFRVAIASQLKFDDVSGRAEAT